MYVLYNIMLVCIYDYKWFLIIMDIFSFWLSLILFDYVVLYYSTVSTFSKRERERERGDNEYIGIRFPVDRGVFDVGIIEFAVERGVVEGRTGGSEQTILLYLILRRRIARIVIVLKLNGNSYRKKIESRSSILAESNHMSLLLNPLKSKASLPPNS